MERRFLQKNELRTDSAGRRLEGYAAVWNAISEDLGGFRETIRSGAFKNAIKGGDVRCLINHDASKILGRTTAGDRKSVV